MLQAMLAGRFGLKLHRETRESAVYALVVSKGGTKIKLSADQTSQDEVGSPQRGEGPNHGGVLLGNGLLIGNAIGLSRFATAISPQLERMVIDRTNLAGRFDIQLRWLPDARELRQEVSGNTLPSQNPSDAPSIFTAIQEQLGLRLEAAKAPVEMIVIDRAERPDAN